MILDHQVWKKLYEIPTQPVFLGSFCPAIHIKSFCKDKIKNDRNELGLRVYEKPNRYISTILLYICNLLG